jgi:hypothetical protein
MGERMNEIDTEIKVENRFGEKTPDWGGVHEEELRDI